MDVEVIETVKLVFYLKSINPNSSMGIPGILRPYPGCELYFKCKKLGFKEPKTLEKWANKNLEFEISTDPKEMPYITDPFWLVHFLNLVSIIIMLKDKEDKKFLFKLLESLLIFRFNTISKDKVNFDLKFLLKFRKFLNKYHDLKSNIKSILSKGK